MRNRLCGEEEAATKRILKGEEVRRYGISATCDAATVHHQPIMAVAESEMPSGKDEVWVNFLKS